MKVTVFVRGGRLAATLTLRPHPLSQQDLAKQAGVVNLGALGATTWSRVGENSQASVPMDALMEVCPHGVLAHVPARVHCTVLQVNTVTLDEELANVFPGRCPSMIKVRAGAVTWAPPT